MPPCWSVSHERPAPDVCLLRPSPLPGNASLRALRPSGVYRDRGRCWRGCSHDHAAPPTEWRDGDAGDVGDRRYRRRTSGRGTPRTACGGGKPCFAEAWRPGAMGSITSVHSIGNNLVPVSRRSGQYPQGHSWSRRRDENPETNQVEVTDDPVKRHDRVVSLSSQLRALASRMDAMLGQAALRLLNEQPRNIIKIR